MAQQAVRKQTPATVPQPVSRAPRRKKMAQPYDYSKTKQTFNDPAAFMEFMRAYPSHHSTLGVTLFLYRVLPVIDLTLIGKKESNIQKGPYDDLQLFSFEAVAEKFGCGRYNIRVTDSNRPDNEREVVRSCTYKVTEAAPPVYDARTLVLNHSDNQSEVNRLILSGELVRDNLGMPRLRTASDGVPPPRQDAAPASAAPPVPGVGGDLVGQIVLAALNRSNQSTSEAVKDTIAVAQLIAGQRPAFDVDDIVERVAARLQPAQAANPLNEFSVYERVSNFIDKVRGPRGDGDGRAGVIENWAPHFEGILREARPFLQELFRGFREMREGSTTAGPRVVAGNNGEVAKEPQLTLEQRIEQIAATGFRKMEEGVTGFDYAASVCLFMPGGLEAYKVLEPLGTVGVMAAASNNPRMRPVLADVQKRAQVEAFLNDFFTYDPDGSEEGDEANAAASTTP